MPKYTCVAKNQEGKTVTKTVEAADKSALIEELQGKGFFIVKIHDLEEGAPPKPAAPVAPPAPRKKKKKSQFRRNKVKLHDLLIFSRQLATMLKAGVPLIRSLLVIESQIESKQFFLVIKDVRGKVEQGGSLSSALADHPKVFNQFWISLVEVGEASGTIPNILNKLAFYLEQQASFRTTIISGIIYPAILFTVAMGAVAFFALVVGPKFQSIFESMNVELPLITRVLLSLFAFIRGNAVIIILACIALFIVFRKYIQTYTGKLLWERFLFGLPTFGNIFKLIIIERFTSQMAILIESGVPILYALDITERLVDNNSCALIVSDVREAVKQGELLVAPMERSEFFPAMCVQMISVGEETGELSKMLNHVATFYQEAVETFMKRFATIVEPFMLVFMGAVIGTIVVAMFLPMFNISQLGGGGGG